MTNEGMPSSVPKASAILEEGNAVEASANFEGNESEILFKRLHNPVIKNQLIDAYIRKKEDKQHFYKTEEWIPFLPEGWDGSERFKLRKGKKSELVVCTEDLEKELENEIPTREEAEKILDAEIDEAERMTAISFKTNEPNESEIPLNWEVPWTGKKATTKQLSIIEAHEKGHVIRRFHELTDTFRKGFEMSKVVYTKELFEYSKKKHANKDEEYVDSDRDNTFEESKEEFLENYFFTGDELAERMSQLKNYFGFSGSEVFTKEHLDYARQHYIEDTNMDNAMSLFFQAITPETEENFLYIINNYGI